LFDSYRINSYDIATTLNS